MKPTTKSGRPRIRRQVEILLAEDVPHLGKQGDIVRVKPGYARNYLLPQGLATIATEANKKRVELHRRKLEELARKKRESLLQLSQRVSQYSVTIQANANADGHLYGSVVNLDISRSLKAAGYPVEPDHVRLDGPIKELGMYEVKLHFAHDIETKVKVWVVPAADFGKPTNK